jgi:aldehyde:ferredoxin oxidoreductase
MMNLFKLFNINIKQNKMDLEINSLLNTFTKVSLKLPLQKKNHLFNDRGHYPIVFGYFLGAINHLKEVKKLNNRHVKKVLKLYLKYNFTNGDTADAEELVGLILELSQSDEGIEYIKVGKQAFKKWLEDKSDIVIDLNQLLVKVEAK